VAPAAKPRFVDTGNPVVAIDCPNCGLTTPRFLQYCRNCAFALWPDGPYASAAFQAWREHDAARAATRRYDVEVPAEMRDQVVDYDERAHDLGIHMPPNSSYPIIICVGFFFLALAAIPFPSAPARIALGVLGVLTFFIGVFGWVALEDVRMFPEGEGGEEHGHGATSGGHGSGEGASANDDGRPRSTTEEGK
jgi:hypothetical protein